MRAIPVPRENLTFGSGEGPLQAEACGLGIGFGTAPQLSEKALAARFVGSGGQQLAVGGGEDAADELGTIAGDALDVDTKEAGHRGGGLGAAVNTISGKVDTINKHIDHVMEDAPTKLKVTVNVSDDDWEKMQGHHTQWLGEEKQMLADQYKQQEVLWQKHSQRLTDIVRNNEGVWISTKLFYIVGSLSLLSIITIVLEIAFYVYFHWIL